MATIHGSVGRQGRNQREDVKVVQALLNKSLTPAAKPLAVDGLVGPKTIGAIEDYQRRVVKLRSPDGRIDVNGPTFRALNGEPVKAPAPVPGELARDPVLMKATMKPILDAANPTFWDAYLKDLGDVTTGWGLLFNLFTTIDEMRKFAVLYRLTRQWGIPASVLSGWLKALYNIGKVDQAAKEAMAYLIQLPPTSKIGKLFEIVGKAGKIVSFTKFLVEYVVHWRNGDYHMAFVEIYKTWLSDALPLAGVIDALETIFSSELATVGGSPVKNRAFFKYLRTVNLIGLGAVAVDTAGVIVVGALEGDMDAMRFQRLMKRAKESPAQVFVEIGDDLADALAKIADMSDAEFADMFSLRSFKEMLDYALSDD